MVNIRNILPKSGTFLLGHLYIYINTYNGTRTNVVRFRRVLLSHVKGLRYHQLRQKASLSQHPTLAAYLAHLMPRKMNEL